MRNIHIVFVVSLLSACASPGGTTTTTRTPAFQMWGEYELVALDNTNTEQRRMKLLVSNNSAPSFALVGLCGNLNVKIVKVYERGADIGEIKCESLIKKQ